MRTVIPVERCRLRVGTERWPWADANAEAITRHWETARAAKPAFFDGRIFMLRDWSVQDGQLDARFVPTRFRKYLYWRAQGFPESGLRDSFGSALIRSAQGHVLLGRQGPGNVNAGLAYPPSGFIDASDMGPDATIDIQASVSREIAEETGLEPGRDIAAQPGQLVVVCGPLVAIVCPFASPLSSQDLAARMAAHIARDPNPELVEPVVVEGAHDRRTDVPDYTRVLLDWVFAA